MGTGPLENTIIEALASRLQARPELQIQIVLDYARGQRSSNPSAATSVTLLTPLLAAFPHNVQLFLFRVPQLSSLAATLLSSPLNETLGVCHAKVYLVDDTLVLSGANLSADYFTNRQDRYVQLRDSNELGQFYHDFVKVVTTFAYQVELEPSLKGRATGRGSSQVPHYHLVPPELAYDSDEAKGALKQALERLVDPTKHAKQMLGSAIVDAWAIPTLQFTPVSMNHDKQVMKTLVETLPRDSQLQVASGYLNFPPFLRDLLMTCDADLDVISAAPQANGFYNARGVKGALPMAYSLIEQDFFERTLGRNFPTVLREFNRPGWTFHGKGMWWRPRLRHSHENASGLPQVTVVGSSNFGQRSYGCDLESNLVMFTRNPVLQRQLQDEYDALTRDAEVVTEHLWRRPERMLQHLFSWKDGYWIRPVSKLITAYL
uniref:CDP-diacylglycerol--glycerol-3-phosphate 3-phosphatidyltransferase n=1 Tax=Hyaloperonospora arabidopsidis (strain Emoy2) TaxID=559515 RepID=M4BIN7_HYAAE